MTLKFEKPGKKKKTRAKIKPPIDRYCRRCGKETGTERICHYEGMYKHKYGKGVGKKVNDLLVSLLCFDCDVIMSTKPDKNDYIKILEFEVEWCWLIIDNRMDNGTH
jgi:hypothetical protein